MIEIVTQTAQGGETDFEKDYLYNFLLSPSKETDGDGRIIIYSSNLRRKHPSDVQANDIIVHLSNENLRYNYRFLDPSNIVLRSLYHPFILKRNCYAIPLGWQTGYENKDRITGEHNKYIWTFIGQMKDYRRPMRDSFCNLTPNFSRFFTEWASEELSKEQIKSIYLDTAFALVPFGNIHADSFRIMEVLEWGCIPVVVEFFGEDYFKYIFGDHPFIVGKNWEDAKGLIQQLWEDKDALARKKGEVEIWYECFKKNLLLDITDILNRKEPSHCSQWKYQKMGHTNLLMLIKWYFHFYLSYDYLIVKRIVGNWLNRNKI